MKPLVAGFNHRWSAALPAIVLIAIALAIAACAGTTTTTSTQGSRIAPLVGCNPGAASISVAAESLTFGHRMFETGPMALYLSGKVAVSFSGSGTEPEVTQALARVRATQGQVPAERSRYTVYNIPDSEDPSIAAAQLAATRGIADAQPLRARYLQDTFPDDPAFGAPPPYTGPVTTATQWDMYYIQMPATWDTWKGASSVPIAIIDTGYDANNIDVCSKVANSAVFDLGGGAQDTQGTAQDMDGHGTNVSGIAAAVTNNFTRFAGVGWNTPLLEVRVFPTPTVGNPAPGASNLDIAAGIDWAVAHGARVINLSLGGPAACDSAEQKAITAAGNAGVVVVVAAGNQGAPALDAPANCHGTISVGASAIDDVSNPSAPTERIATYSNWGSNGDGLTLVAPGGDPSKAQASCGTSVQCDYLQWITNNYSTTAHKFAGTGVLIAGTSQATPHVSGVAALMIAKNGTLTPVNVKQLLELFADDIGGGVKQGAGRLNAFQTLSHT
ncbi:MAG TPA: S8 family serine peptidase [Candidatus Binatus sp.]|nr:S8 family serine peptidase [Candidatus Binatus sp.]